MYQEVYVAFKEMSNNDFELRSYTLKYDNVFPVVVIMHTDFGSSLGKSTALIPVPRHPCLNFKRLSNDSQANVKQETRVKF